MELKLEMKWIWSEQTFSHKHFHIFFFTVSFVALSGCVCFELILPVLFADKICSLNEAPAARVERTHLYAFLRAYYPRTPHPPFPPANVKFILQFNCSKCHILTTHDHLPFTCLWTWCVSNAATTAKKSG